MGRKKDRYEELTEKMKEGIREVMDSEKFKKWLEVQSHFHNYSPNNTILILMQKPDATRVAGYRSWQKLGRQVQKGESAIWIWAPKFETVYVEEEDEETGETVRKKKRHLAGFIPVHVFDVSQTKGEELPEIAEEIETDSEEGQQILRKFEQLAEDRGHKIRYYTDRKAHGYFNPATGEIGIKEAAADQQAKTLVHEVAHALTHDLLADKEETYAAGELVAEGTAFMVCNRLGLNTDRYSFEYLAAWVNRTEDPEKAMKKVTKWIQKTAEELLTAIDEVTEEQDEDRGQEAA